MAEHLPTGTLPWVLASAVAAISLGLLAASGVAKFIDPEPTTGAMRAARLPAANLVTYGLAVVEVIAGVGGLVIGGVTVALAAVLYGGFAVFTFAAVRNRIPIQSCGCFGREDTPPSYVHVAFNVVAAVALIVVATTAAAPIDWALSPVEIGLSLGFSATGVYAAYLLLARLPQVLELARPSS